MQLHYFSLSITLHIHEAIQVTHGASIIINPWKYFWIAAVSKICWTAVNVDGHSSTWYICKKHTEYCWFKCYPFHHVQLKPSHPQLQIKCCYTQSLKLCKLQPVVSRLHKIIDTKHNTLLLTPAYKCIK